MQYNGLMENPRGPKEKKQKEVTRLRLYFSSVLSGRKEKDESYWRSPLLWTGTKEMQVTWMKDRIRYYFSSVLTGRREKDGSYWPRKLVKRRQMAQMVRREIQNKQQASTDKKHQIQLNFKSCYNKAGQIRLMSPRRCFSWKEASWYKAALVENTSC